MRDGFDIESLKRRLLPEGLLLKSGKLGLPVAAVAIIINPKDQGGSVLLIKRTERQGDPWSGQMAFPGGHKAENDQTFLETAVREAREEVGIQLREHELLGVLPLVYTRSRHVVVAPFVFQLKTDVRIQLNEEVAESFWAPLSELEEVKVSKSEVHVEEGNLTVDSYIYRGHVIWGLTFRIINILVNRAQDSNL